MELVGSVSGKFCALNKPGGGKKMHSVFEGWVPVSMCILRSNRAKWLENRVSPFLMSVLDSQKMRRHLHKSSRRYLRAFHI